MQQPLPTTSQPTTAQEEQQEAKERSAPSSKIIHEAILKEGREELARPSDALFWSGLAAGLSMGLSMMAEGVMVHYLPDSAWRPLVANLGYSLGFLVVILGRQQLFTENTLTPILPLLELPTWRSLRNVLRLWGVVLVANLLGCLALALVVAHSDAFEPAIRAEFAHMGQEELAPSFGTVLLRGIFAGWMIALMVWILPFADTGRIWVIIIITYVVGICHFSHVIAGTVEVFTLAASGGASWGQVLGGFTVPALLGNILGGVLLVAGLNHAQVVTKGGNSHADKQAA
ncbi:formate/nitrite transporter family protein [Hymenobacter artigasi]|uniref:Formate/nitrite transporter FocA (FNT family) n=1 Tax=Hymenobacter artigasi TaxID=2719616 RepID=A0ABX1HHT5_9BACT|nr:formate/nitrite transporter family protein [Hymenobacter artigasi]NKI89829.1 formate/nitrite transporter FocA (FNT family) [Hymenobacter artigasi]